LTRTYADRPPLTLTGAAQVTFERARQLVFSGMTPGGPVPRHAYGLKADASGAWIRIDLPGHEEWSRRDVQDAIVELCGISCRAPIVTCSVLLDVTWRKGNAVFPAGRLWDAIRDSVAYVRDDHIGDDGCRVVTAVYGGVENEIWIRKTDHLVRRWVERGNRATAEFLGSASRYESTGLEIRHEFSDFSIGR
jgi:hypothetical protein